MAGVSQPAEHPRRAVWCIQAHSIGHPTVANGIVGQHHRDAPLGTGGLAQLHPASAVLGQPRESRWIRLQAGNGRGQGADGLQVVTKTARPRGDPSIQLRHHHLQRQIHRIQPLAALQPLGPAAAAAEQLQHRPIEPIPERAAKAGLFGLHRCKGRARNHQLSVLLIQQVVDAGLHRRVSQAADPEQTGPQSLLPKCGREGIRQGKVSGLKLSPIQNNAHRSPGFIAPIPGHRIGARHHHNVVG